MKFWRRKQEAPEAVAQDAETPATMPRLAPRSPSEALKPTTAPPPPPPRIRKPRGGLLSLMSGLVTLVTVLALGALIGLAVVGREATRPGPLAEDKVVVVPRNSGMSEIATLLRREGVIEQPLLFQAYVLLNRSRGQLKAGEFMFKRQASINDAIETLVEGKAVLHAITIPEGLTSEQIVERLNQNEILTGEVKEIPPEGSLLPDTYKFERGMTRQQLIASMRNQQRQVLNQVWARRSTEIPVKSPQDLVTLASIVEKETGRADERPRVAGVFINRLNKRMRLQSDPTIVYGLVGGKGTLGRGILRSEIEKPTPYNTYTIEGLPPGPIANPGRAALEAVANPSRTKDLYFVADGTGGHAFAESYEQHLRNVARWRQIEKGRETGQTDAPVVDRAEPPLPANPAATEGTPSQAEDATRSTNPADASEGTPLDPLRNSSFDLTSPKTVPNLAVGDPAQKKAAPKPAPKPKPAPRTAADRKKPQAQAE